MYLKFLIYTLAFYFLFRFIARVVWPLIQISRATQAKMKEMQEQMSRMQNASSSAEARSASSGRDKKRNTEGEYIEYEEVR